jgi:hypothetical protein
VTAVWADDLYRDHTRTRITAVQIRDVRQEGVGWVENHPAGGVSRWTGQATAVAGSGDPSR